MRPEAEAGGRGVGQYLTRSPTPSKQKEREREREGRSRPVRLVLGRDVSRPYENA